MDKIFNWLTDNKSKLMNKFIYKMIPNRRDADDFYQDLYLIMADKDISKMNKIYEAKEMEQYLYVIIRNNLMSVNSRYYYTYRKPIGEDLTEYYTDGKGNDSFTIEEKTVSHYEENSDRFIILQELEDDYKALINKINKYLDVQLTVNPKFFYDKKIFEMYYNEDNTYRGLSDLVGIPPTSIYNTVTKNRVKIVDLFKTEIENINKKLIYYYTL
tara:strand:+ start:1296 stop:1937 length:642 start_codon:yes stop_codon:yes gene_type:complete